MELQDAVGGYCNMLTLCLAQQMMIMMILIRNAAQNLPELSKQSSAVIPKCTRRSGRQYSWPCNFFFKRKPHQCLKLFHSITLTKFYSVLKLEILGMVGGLIQECISPNLWISIILYGENGPHFRIIWLTCYFSGTHWPCILRLTSNWFFT